MTLYSFEGAHLKTLTLKKLFNNLDLTSHSVRHRSTQAHSFHFLCERKLYWHSILRPSEGVPLIYQFRQP